MRGTVEINTRGHREGHRIEPWGRQSSGGGTSGAPWQRGLDLSIPALISLYMQTAPQDLQPGGATSDEAAAASLVRS